MVIKKNHLDIHYWRLQISGWTLFFVILTISSVFIVEVFSLNTILYFICATCIGFFYTHLFRNHLKTRTWNQINSKNLIFLFFLAPLVLAILWGLSILPIAILLFENGSSLTISEVVLFLFNLYAVYFVWTLIYAFYKLFISYKETEIEKWKLEASVKEAQLIALKSQINPHFIFNSLNNIRSLVVENPERAREMITNLSGLLRYSIKFNNLEKVSIRDELNIVKNYLQLESIQFEERLNFSIQVNEEVMEIPIPPMSVQLLVENAIKHGISELAEGGEIRITCELNKEELDVRVTNTGKLNNVTKNESTGIGIKNARERLQFLYGKNATFSLKNLENNMVEARFIIPIKEKN